MTPNTLVPDPAGASTAAAILSADFETFTVKLPARIARYLRNIADEEGKTPEQFIAASAGASTSVAIDESRGDQSSWAAECEAANADGTR